MGNPATVMAATQAAKSIPTPVYLIGGAFLLYGIYKIASTVRGAAETLNLVDTQEEKDGKEHIKNSINKNYWQPYYYQQFPNSVRLTTTEANRLANQLFHANGFFSYREQNAFSVIGQLRSKAQLSQIAEAFTRVKRFNLRAWLTEKMDPEHFTTLVSMIERLPNA